MTMKFYLESNKKRKKKPNLIFLQQQWHTTVCVNVIDLWDFYYLCSGPKTVYVQLNVWSLSSFREAVEYSPKCVYASVYIIITLLYAEFQNKSIFLWPKERKCDPCISPSVQNMCLKEYKEHFQNKDLIRTVDSYAVKKVNYLAAIDSL